jgi:hypothetical protein
MLAALGLTRRDLFLEKGRSIPTPRTLQRIAKATGHELIITFTCAA